MLNEQDSNAIFLTDVGVGHHLAKEDSIDRCCCQIIIGLLPFYKLVAIRSLGADILVMDEHGRDSRGHNDSSRGLHLQRGGY